MILEPPKIKSVTVSIVSPSICHEVMGPDAMILVFRMLSFKPTLSLSAFTFIKRPFSSSLLSAIRVVSSAYLRLWIFLLAILIPACASSSKCPGVSGGGMGWRWPAAGLGALSVAVHAWDLLRESPLSSLPAIVSVQFSSVAQSCLTL